MEGLSKKGKGLMDMDNIVVIAAGGDIRSLNGNGKSTIKTRLKIYKCHYITVIEA